MRLSLEAAAPILAELGNETRLAIVRLLVRAGDDGLTVGDIQQAIGVPGSTLTHHLQRLRGAGLVSQTREGSTLWCRAEMACIRATPAWGAEAVRTRRRRPTVRSGRCRTDRMPRS